MNTYMLNLESTQVLEWMPFCTHALFYIGFIFWFCILYTRVSLLKARNKNVLERHRDTLLRSTYIDVTVVILLRDARVVDLELESILMTEEVLHKRNHIIYDYLEKSSENTFHAFISVMRETNQCHVANLLTENSKGKLYLCNLNHSRCCSFLKWGLSYASRLTI